MYRSAAALLILLFSIPAFSVDSRVERWNLRIEKLKKIQTESLSGKGDKALIAELTGSEIKSSEEFLSILDRYRKDDGSLKSDTRKYSLAEIEKKVKDTSLPAISLCYLTDLYRTADNSSVKEKIASDIIHFAEKKFGDSKKISPAEGVALARFYIMEKGMAEFESTVKNSTAEVLSKTQYELSRKDYNSNDTDISRIIQKQMEEILPAKKFFEYKLFEEKYILPVPGWKYISDEYSGAADRKWAVMNFVYNGGGSIEVTERVKDIESAEDEIFIKAKSKISRMLTGTTQGTGAGGNNPFYEIPDVQKLGIAIDEIDKYRKNLITNIKGNESKEQISKLKNNNTGIAARSINRLETQYRNEELRIERLKKSKGSILIYNEELFRSSRKHFHEASGELLKYADLSGKFIEILYSSGKNDPQKYIDFHKYRSERYLLYISFTEKLTGSTTNLSVTGSEKLRSLYKGIIAKVLVSSKNLIKPESIPFEIRGILTKELLKDYALINADLRINGSQGINAARKNYDESISGFTRTSSLKKESSAASENRIGQDETDRLFNYAKKCSVLITSMNYTETALKKYKDEYSRISEEIKKGNIPPEFGAQNRGENFFASLPGFNAAAIETETATRELLAKEGMESLSSSITLIQYYKRKGIRIKLEPDNDEIVSMRNTFRKSPEIVVSSWKMNGKNFREVDLNIAAELKKNLNKNAWNNNRNDSVTEIFKINEPGINVSFNPPAGWKKIPENGNEHIQKIIFESPDKKGNIEITSICEEGKNLQALAGLWPEKSGYSMIEKNWGKKNDSDYIKITSRNRYDGIMESYLLSSKGYVIILSGKTSGVMYRYLNKTLSDTFKNLEVSSLN